MVTGTVLQAGINRIGPKGLRGICTARPAVLTCVHVEGHEPAGSIGVDIKPVVVAGRLLAFLDAEPRACAPVASHSLIVRLLGQIGGDVAGEMRLASNSALLRGAARGNPREWVDRSSSDISPSLNFRKFPARRRIAAHLKRSTRSCLSVEIVTGHCTAYLTTRPLFGGTHIAQNAAWPGDSTDEAGHVVAK